MIKTCARCGKPFQVSDHPKVGRPRRWCSSACRRLASEERRAAEVGHTAVTFIKEAAGLDDQVRAVLESPSACRRILRELSDRDTRGALGDAKWSSVADELARLRRPSLPSRWRR
jgi:hypothetical protein